MGKRYYVYIMTSKYNTVLYTGITSDLKRRAYQHKEKIIGGFTEKYNINTLVYCESYGHVKDAIAREKQIKAGSRKSKIELVNRMNPEWKDLYEQM